MRVALSLALAGCLFLCGCVSGDIYKPLVRREAPKYDEVVPILASTFPEVQPQQINSSLKDLWFSRFHFSSLIGYEDSGNYLSFGDLDDSLKTFKDNPYTWSLLGAYLALERQPTAAAYASDRALQILRKVRETVNRPLDDDLLALEWTTRINQAIFLNLQGNYDKALADLETPPPDPINEPFVELAVVWTKCASLIGSGRSNDALVLLHSVPSKTVDQLPETKLFDSSNYPQYFHKHKRKAIFAFLEGEALLRLSRTGESESILRESVNMDGELWVAQLSLATALNSEGKRKEAKAVLEKLVSSNSSGGLYSYDLAAFNLANLHLESGESDRAIEEYRHVIDAAAERDRDFTKRIASHLPSEVRALIVPAASSRIVMQANNNLGAATLLKARQGVDRREAALAAIPYFEKAQADDSGVAVSNIGKANWLAGDQQEAVDEMAKAVQKDPRNRRARDTLLQFGLSSSDPELKYRALTTYVDALNRDRGSADRAVLRNLKNAAPVLLSPAEASKLSEQVDSLLVAPELSEAPR